MTIGMYDKAEAGQPVFFKTKHVINLERYLHKQSIADHVSGQRTNVLRDNPEPPKVGCRQTSPESLFAYLQLAKPSPSADTSGYRGHRSVIAHETPLFPFPEVDRRRSHLYDRLRDISKDPTSFEAQAANTRITPSARKR